MLLDASAGLTGPCGFPRCGGGWGLLDALASGLEQLKIQPQAVLILEEIQTLEELARQALESIRDHFGF